MFYDPYQNCRVHDAPDPHCGTSHGAAWSEALRADAAPTNSASMVGMGSRGRPYGLVGVLILASACSTGRSLRDVYDHERAEPPLVLYWRHSRQEPNTVIAEGLAQNSLPTKFEFTDVRLTLVGRGRGGRVVERSVTRVPDFVGPETPFRAVLSSRVPIESVELHVEYRREDMEGDGHK